MGEALITRRGGGIGTVYDVSNATLSCDTDGKLTISGLNLPQGIKMFSVFIWSLITWESSGSSAVNFRAISINFVDGLCYMDAAVVSDDDNYGGTASRIGSFTFAVVDGNLVIDALDDSGNGVKFQGTSNYNFKNLGGVIVC